MTVSTEQARRIRASLERERAERAASRRAAAQVLRRLQIAQIALFASSLVAVMCLSPGAASVLPRESTQDEENTVKDLKMRGAVLAAAVSLGGAQGAVAQSAPIEWPVSAGGNGHWYAASPLGLLWHDARLYAESFGGHLATTTSEAELLVIRPLFAVGGGEWDFFLGAYRTSNTAPWQWVTSEPWSYTAWEPGAPDNGPESLYLEVVGRPIVGGVPNPGFGRWNDELFYAAGGGQRFILEWSADCDQNGLVDFGEIRRGEKADANMNNIPDCCEEPAGCCPGDIDGDGTTDGIDLAIVLARWGTNPKDYPKADANSDGVVDGQDLSVVLNGWGSCQ
jgi:hypothetical protein